MNPFITTTFLIIIAFAAVNMIVSLGLYKSTHRDLYLRLSLSWLTLILNFLIQSQAQDGELGIILAFGFGLVPLNLLGYATLTFYQKSFPWKGILIFSATAFALTFLIHKLDVPFYLKAMPMAAAAALPLIYTIGIIFFIGREFSTPLLKVHGVLLILLGIHCFNFAFFRMVPEAQLWGWAVAYGLYQTLALLIPALTLDFSHREEQHRLQSIIDSKIQDIQQASQNLERLLQQKNFLLRTLTHDINNPLMVIQGRLAQARNKGLTSEVILDSMEAMLRRIQGLIHQVKHFESIDQAKEDLHLEELNLMECVDEVLELFEDRCASKEINIEFSRTTLEKCMIRMDHEAFINSVLPNILGNALKFSNRRGRILIELKKIDEGHVKLMVTDFGIGMSAEMIRNLYDFTTNTSRKGTSGEVGTGFGIPILAKTMKSCGGELQIFSEEQTEEKPGFTRVELTIQGVFESTQFRVA